MTDYKMAKLSSYYPNILSTLFSSKGGLNSRNISIMQHRDIKTLMFLGPKTEKISIL